MKPKKLDVGRERWECLFAVVWALGGGLSSTLGENGAWLALGG